MVFTRKWDASCPRIWDQWEEDGVKWVIQDLAPEDDETALQILVEHLLPDERLCAHSDVLGDPESKRSIVEFWRDCLKQRMSLGCYTEVDGRKTLVGLNVCVVESIEERFPSTPIEGEAWNNVFRAMEYLETKCDPFKLLGLDTLLHALGLVVKRDYRGRQLGSRILAAREPLCLANGVKATATMFTGPASQISAARSGFETACVVSFKDLAEQNLNYPKDESRVIKLMTKRYDEN